MASLRSFIASRHEPTIVDLAPSTSQAAAMPLLTRAQAKSAVDSETFIVECSLETIIFPKRANAAFRDPRLYPGCEGFVIAKATCAVNGIATQMRIQGQLPHHAPYYFYRCRMKHGNHPKYGSFFAIDSILECTLFPLAPSFLAWMMEHELGWTLDARARALDLLPPPDAQGAVALDMLPAALRTSIMDHTRYGQELQHAPLREWFPETTPAILQKLASASADKRATFYTSLRDNVWRFLFRPLCREFGAHGCALLPPTAITKLCVQHVCDIADNLPGNVANLPPDTLLPKPARDLLSAAVECYTQLVAWCKNRGHTVFYAHNVRPEWRGAPLAFLVSSARILVHEHVETMSCYWLAKDYAHETAICAQLEQLFARHRTTPPHPQPGAPPLPSGTTPEQRAVIEAVPHQHIVMVRGGPGTGKTWTIEQLLLRYGKRHTLLCTLTGSMVAGHRERNLLHSSTIHRPLVDRARFVARVAALDTTIARLEEADDETPTTTPKRQRELANLRRQRARFASRLAKLERRLADCHVAIIDEFSNVDLKLFARFLTLCSNLRTLVLVFDEWQIRPIGRGQPCLDMLRAMCASFGIQLLANQRAAGTAAACILANDACVLAHKPRRAVFEEVEAGRRIDALPGSGVPREGCFLVIPSNRGLAQDMTWIYTILLAGWNDVQMLALTNAECRSINASMQRALRPNEDTVDFFRGQRLTVHRNFEACRVRLDAKGMLTVPDRSFAHSTTRTVHDDDDDDDAEDHVEDHDEDHDEGHDGSTLVERRTPTRRPLPTSDAISNGEVVIFESWREFDIKRRRWLPERTVLAETIPTGRIRFLVVRDGRYFCVHAGYTPRNVFLLAYGQTIDKAQGREFDAVGIKLPVDPGPFGPRHLHVALSRGKRCVVLYGTRAQFTAFARNRESPRQTLFAWRLRSLVSRWEQRRAGLPAAFLSAVAPFTSR